MDRKRLDSEGALTVANTIGRPDENRIRRRVPGEGAGRESGEVADSRGRVLHRIGKPKEIVDTSLLSSTSAYFWLRSNRFTA